MTEDLVLFIPDRKNSVDKFHILREDRADREGVDPRAAAFLLLQGSASRDGIIDGHILESVHLLEIGAQSHQEQACQGDMILLAEVHEPLRGLLLQVEDIQRGRRIAGCTECGAQFRIFEHLSCRFQLISSCDAAEDRLSLLDLLLEILGISLLCLAPRLIREILLQLFEIGRHFLRIPNPFKLRIAVELDDILQKTDQRLRVHDHMLAEEIKPVEPVRHLDHDNPCKLRILKLKRDSRPRLHRLFRFFHRPVREIDELDVLIFMLNYVLIVVSFFILCEADAHPFASLIRFIDRSLQLVPVKLELDRQARPDIEHSQARAVRRVVHMELLCDCQRIYFVSLPCLHHFMTPPINESNALS